MKYENLLLCHQESRLLSYIYSQISLERQINQLKAQLVAEGYIHTYCADYFESFSPIAPSDFISVRSEVVTFLQLHIKNAFLHGDL